MFFKALAFDFDGSLASDDQIRPGVREALERARQVGLRLILVTGRTFFELSRVCDCLDLFAVVAVPNDVLGYHAARGDFSRWVLDVFADRELARQLDKSVARWRRGETPDLGRAIDRLILNRYGPEG